MIRIPVLSVKKGKGVVIYVEFETRQGAGTLFLDAKLCYDNETRDAINTAFSLLKIKKKDMLVRVVKGDGIDCVCGGSLGLAVYLGMHACIHGLKLRPNTFATGGIDKKGKIIPIAELAEKIKAILGKADVLLVPEGQSLPVEGIKVKEVSNLKEAMKIALIR